MRLLHILLPLILHCLHLLVFLLLLDSRVVRERRALQQGACQRFGYILLLKCRPRFLVIARK